jgi:glycosyltransferase involved in cell wall biosynthesis
MLDSILAQTYKNIEMICVDDGSTDETEAVISSYSKPFENNSMRLIYVKQQNCGFVSAINNGLSFVNGDYLSYLDSDDFFVEETIEKRVASLEANKDFAVVVNDYYTVDESNVLKPIGRGGENYGNLNFQPNQFYLALTGMSITWTGSYMIRMRDFDIMHRGRKIHPCPIGQNYQTLYPLYYRFKRLYINEPLSYYVLRSDSDFHRKRTDREWKERCRSLLMMLDDVLQSLDMPDWERHKCIRMSFLNHYKGEKADAKWQN